MTYVLEKDVISGTDIAGIMGLSPYAKPYDIWNKRKNGVAKPISEQMQPFVEWGIRLEDTIAKKYAENNGVKVRRCPVKRKQWRVGSPDRIVSFNGARWGLEVKTYSHAVWKEIPIHYALQCRWYMYLTGLKRWDLAVLFQGNTYREWTLEYDVEQEKEMLEEVSEFYTRYIFGEEIPPSPHEVLKPEIHYSDRIDDLWGAYEDLKLKEKKIKLEKQRVRTLIDGEASNHAQVCGDNITVTYKKSFRNTLDYVKLSDSGIDLDDFRKISPPFLTLSAKENK